MWPAVRDSLSSLADLIFPRRCAACQVRDELARPFCSSCSAAFLQLVGQAFCIRCGTSAAEGMAVDDDGCPHCPTPMPRFDRVVRLAAYEPPLATVIGKVKFHGEHATCRWLGRLLAQKVQATPELSSAELVEPVPLHWRRRLQRGYNQSAVIARAAARLIGLPEAGELVRIRDTRPQVNLPRTQRAENVKGAFAVPRSRRRAIAGRHVLLVDDVTTTCATASEAARAMLAAGAARVSLAVLAKADPPAAFTPRHA